MNELVGKLLTQKEVPFKYVTSVGTLTVVLSRPRRFSWKSGVEMEEHEKMQVVVWREVGACVCRREKCLCYPAGDCMCEFHSTTWKRTSKSCFSTI